MYQILSIDNIVFSAFGYQMSLVELVGTLLNLISVILVVFNNVLTWPIGIIAAVLFGYLFYQIRLYSDLFEQVYYIISGFYGWNIWLREKDKKGSQVKISHNKLSTNIIWLIGIAFFSLASGYFIARIHLLMPQYFPEKASFPYLDATTTIVSFAANILLARKKIESWYLWIFVDVIAIGLYFAKGVIFISILYFLFLILAIKGYKNWTKILNESEE